MPHGCEKYFRIETRPMSWEDIDTPTPIVDLDVVERNAVRWQKRCDELGLANRPHIKTHKLGPLARYQIALGAKGITVQTLGEAEVMADAGLKDMLVTFNIVGKPKLARLVELAKRAKIMVVADNPTVAHGLNWAGGRIGNPMDVLIECDTGGKRNGVQSPEEAAALAKLVDAQPGTAYAGLMTFPAHFDRLRSIRFLARAKDLVQQAGLRTNCISTGGTPDMWTKAGLEIVTEYRAGTYIYNDRSLIAEGVGEDDCALDVLATVVSRPTRDRAVLDAGSKALTSDLRGLEGFGRMRRTGAVVYALSEEHGLLDVTELDDPPKVGDVVRLIPNHVCPVSNLFDNILLCRGKKLLGYAKVDARGRTQ